MHILNLLALSCFLAAAVVAGIQRNWSTALLSAGAFLVVLTATPLA